MSDKNITKFEDLSNEMLFEIFAYLPGEELFQAFQNLQYRINRILNDPSLLTCLVYAKISYLQSVCALNEIRFVSIARPAAPTLAADLQSSSVMPHALQLLIDTVYVPDLIVGLTSIRSQMPNLVHVSINAYHHYSASASNNAAFIIERLLDLPHLRTLALNFTYDSKETVNVCLSTFNQTSFLERLSIAGCSLALLSVLDLMQHSPRLDSLQLEIQRNKECPDYSIFRQLVKATLHLMGFDELNLQKLFRAMTSIVNLRLDHETLNSTARLSIGPATRVGQIPIRYFDHR